MNLGSKEISRIHLGSKEISRIHLGRKEILKNNLILLENGVLNDDYKYTLTKVQNNSSNNGKGYYCNITTSGNLLRFNASADSTASGGGYNTLFKYTSDEINLKPYKKLIIENLSFDGGIAYYENYFGVTVGGVGIYRECNGNAMNNETLEFDISSLESGKLEFTLSAFKTTANGLCNGYLYVQNIRLE